ncbi:hypothetical protein BJX99DRAFT_261486 [Aspergillus californicus]
MTHLALEDPVMLSSLEGETKDLAELLIGHGADSHVTNVDGRTALFFAVYFRRRGLIAVLQPHGLTMDTRDQCNMTPAGHVRITSSELQVAPADLDLDRSWRIQ